MLQAFIATAVLSGTFGITPTPARHAIIIAAPHGGYGDAPLSYAQSDALQVADVLRHVGGFAPDEVEVVLQPSRAALGDVFARLQNNGLHDNDFLFVYYSGHGDVFGMHLGVEHVAWRELLRWTNQAQAHTRLLVVDACNSGALTRLKGGKRVAAFMPNIAENSRTQALPQGLAILTSSGASEYSVESEAFSASLFTHHFVAALSGAADRNNDGAVSLSEAYEYTTDRLGTAQASFARRHQHPTFRYSLRGETDLWLSRIQAKSHDGAVFQLSQSGTYVWHGSDSAQMLEVTVPAGEQRRIDVPTGQYHLSWRHGSDLAETEVDVQPGAVWRMNADSFAPPPVVGDKVANKGGGVTEPAVSIGAVAAAGPPANEPSNALDLQGGAGTSLVPNASVTARAALTFSRRLTTRLPLVWDMSLAFENAQLRAPAVASSLFATSAMAGLRMVHEPASWLRISYGLRVGGDVVVQQGGGASATQLAPSAAAVLRLEVPFGQDWFVVGEAQERVTQLRIDHDSNLVNYRLQTVGTVGVGVRF